MKILSSLILIKQKHAIQSVQSDSKTNEYFEYVLLVNQNHADYFVIFSQ